MRSIYNPKFTIVIPTYNEEKDIQSTINSLLELQYDNFDILIVDDSTDSTPVIIRENKDSRIRLIIPENRKGRCEARNVGIIESDCDILIILNADVHLPKSFIRDLIPHYKNGADYVLVNSTVENTDDLFARYVDCKSREKTNDPDWVKSWKWTEGFSIKKEVIMQTSLFPSGYVVPIEAGEDVEFGENLESIGAKKVIDLNIMVTHIAPSTFSEYWNIRKGRGAGTPQIRRFVDGFSYFTIGGREYLKLLRFVIFLITLLPMLIINFKLSRYSNKNRLIETFRFCYAWTIEQVAFSVGAFYSLREIIIKERG